MTQTERASYTALDFGEWSANNSLVLTPKFQRRGVWDLGARSFLIDTLLHGMPVPPIYLRVRQSPDKKRIEREVVDGQQRIATVLKFVSGEFALTNAVSKEFAGKTFSQLPPAAQDQIREFSFICEMFKGVSDAEILEVFRRLNTYSIPLNNQELRNGKFFGLFKQSAYRLAQRYIEFWRKHSIFSEKSISRMLEVELTSELMIAQLDGMQDKKKSIDDFYAKYDEDFGEQKQIESRFGATLEEIDHSLEEPLGESEFSRAPLFYTLFCAIYHRLYGLKQFRQPTPKRPLNTTERSNLNAAIDKLSEVIAEAKQGKQIPRQYLRFVTACLRQTDNIDPRNIRLDAVYREVFLR